MGPRRKLTLAISELKDQHGLKQEQVTATSVTEDKDSVPSRKTSRSRPPLTKQSSTDVAEAYRQVCVDEELMNVGVLNQDTMWHLYLPIVDTSQTWRKCPDK